MEDPVALLARLRLGREEYCQRLLTMLIVDGPYPKWNRPTEPSALGAQFLMRLDDASFGRCGSARSYVHFVDEFELPKRNEAEAGGAPDYAVVTDDRVWIIELKTERASHRPAQVPFYFELAQHHFPGRRIDITYLTPTGNATVSSLAPGQFAHLTWGTVVPVIEATWASAGTPYTDMTAMLAEVLAASDQPWRSWRAERLGITTIQHVMSDPLGQAMALAARTGLDGRQRAVEGTFGSLDDLIAFRVELHEAIHEHTGASDLAVRPWLWRAATSGGAPMTACGKRTGYELRLSRDSALAKSA